MSRRHHAKANMRQRHELQQRAAVAYRDHQAIGAWGSRGGSEVTCSIAIQLISIGLIGLQHGPDTTTVDIARLRDLGRELARVARDGLLIDPSGVPAFDNPIRESLRGCARAGSILARLNTADIDDAADRIEQAGPLLEDAHQASERANAVTTTLTALFADTRE